MSKKLSPTERLAALIGAREWLGTYDAGPVDLESGLDPKFTTIADGATAVDGVPEDMANAYALLGELIEQEQHRVLVATYRKAARNHFAAQGIKCTAKQVNDLAATAMAQREQ